MKIRIVTAICCQCALNKIEENEALLSKHNNQVPLKCVLASAQEIQGKQFVNAIIFLDYHG